MKSRAVRSLFRRLDWPKCFSVPIIVTSPARVKTGVKPIMTMGGLHDSESQREAWSALRSN